MTQESDSRRADEPQAGPGADPAQRTAADDVAAERWVVALENAHIPDAVLFGPFSTETSAAVYAASCRDRQPGDETTGQVTYRVVKLHPPINPDDLSADVGVFVQGD